MMTYLSINVENAKERIVLQLINTEKNKDLLKDLPHKNFLDLSIIFVLVEYNNNKDMVGSIKITYNLAEKLRLDVEQLFQLAVVNTKNLFPFKVMTTYELFLETCMKQGISRELAEVMLYEPDEVQNAIWVLTNRQKFNGGVVLLYEEEIQKLSRKLESDLYLLPSSQHEIIAVPTEIVGNTECLMHMVKSTNEEVVGEKDFLSDSLYHYNRNSRTISLVR